MKRIFILALGLLAAQSALAQNGRTSSFLPGGGSGGPIYITADKLDYFDKQQKLVYGGGVLVKQGTATMKAAMISIFFAGEGAAAAGPGNLNQIQKMEAAGPVTITSQDQVGTGDRADFDRPSNKVRLIGRVTLSQGPNIQTCDVLVYDLTANTASCTGNVRGLITPGSAPPDAPRAQGAPKPAAPRPQTNTVPRNPR